MDVQRSGSHQSSVGPADWLRHGAHRYPVLSKCSCTVSYSQCRLSQVLEQRGAVTLVQTLIVTAGCGKACSNMPGRRNPGGLGVGLRAGRKAWDRHRAIAQP